MSTPYDRGYVPPAPILLVELALPESAKKIRNVPALIDTGADMSFVASRFLNALAAQSIESLPMRSLRGERREIPIYALDIGIEGLNFPSVDVVANEMGEEVILGRNCLNKLILLLDGPGQIADSLERRPSRLR